METPERPPARAVSILGHPVTGVAPIAFLSAGWVLLALQIMPWARDQFARIVQAGGVPSLGAILPPPVSIVVIGIVSGGCLLAGLALFAVWVRSAGGLGPLSDRLLKRNEILAGIVLLATGVLTSALISRGDPVLDVARGHIARGWLWHEYLRAGTFPRWTDLWYGGFSADKHYPPLSHLLQALIGFLRFSPYDAAKELAWFCRMAGAVGFALFCARVHRDQRAGLLGGILYALAPTIHAAWIAEGRLPACLIFGILPWALLAAERLATGAGGFRSGALLALAMGGMVLSHLGQARLAVALVGLYFLIRAVVTVATRGARAPSIPGLLIGGLGGAALAAAFLYPLLREAPLLNDPLPAGIFAPGIPGRADLAPFIRWNAAGQHYLGISVVLLAVAGIVRAIFDRREGGRGIGPVPILLLCVLPWFFVRLTSGAPELLILGAQIAAAGVVRRSTPGGGLPPFGRGLLPLSLLLVLADLAPISLGTSYMMDRPERDRLYAGLAGRLASGRFLEIPLDGTGRPRPSCETYAATLPVASIGGPYVKGVPRTFAHAAAMIDVLAGALAKGGPIPRDLIRLLALHDVRYVVLTSEGLAVLPAGIDTTGFAVDREIRALRVDQAAPVAILVPGFPKGPDPPAVVIDESGLPGRVARELARAGMEWIAKADPRPVNEARAVALPNRLEIQVPDLGAVTLRIARNQHPDTQIRVDGMTWPWRPGPLGGIVIDLDSGPHRIEVWSTEDKIRRGCRYGQWALAALLFLVAIGPRRR